MGDGGLVVVGLGSRRPRRRRRLGRLHLHRAGELAELDSDELGALPGRMAAGEGVDEPDDGGEEEERQDGGLEEAPARELGGMLLH